MEDEDIITQQNNAETESSGETAESLLDAAIHDVNWSNARAVEGFETQREAMLDAVGVSANDNDVIAVHGIESPYSDIMEGMTVDTMEEFMNMQPEDTQGVDGEETEQQEQQEEQQEEQTEPQPVIPYNSESLIVDESHSRFSSAIWFDKIQETSVILAGLGGIGSYVAYLLSRVNIGHLTVFDPDIVDRVNMSGQMYKRSQVGTAKTQALRTNLIEFSNYYNVSLCTEHYRTRSLNGPVMICGFDNMEARKVFFSRWLEYVRGVSAEERQNCLFIDGRLAAEEFQVLCIKGNDTYHINKYRELFLFSDSEADETICSYKQTTHCANMIASIMANLFVNFIANKCEPLMERPVPFFTSYDSERMFFTTDDML